MSALRNVAIIRINPTLLRKWYKYIQRISFCGFLLTLESRPASLAIVCSQLTSQPVSQPVMCPPRHSCIFPGCHSVQGRGVAPMGDVGVLTLTLFLVRQFNTHTLSAVFPRFCTNGSLQSFSFSGCSVSDRLMIGCSALSPASLSVLDLLFSSC